jgi:hypothetical protein
VSCHELQLTRRIRAALERGLAPSTTDGLLQGLSSDKEATKLSIILPREPKRPSPGRFFAL